MKLAERVASRYLRAMHLMTPPLKRRELDDLVEIVVMAARDNARETEGVGRPKGPNDFEWEARVDRWIAPSIESILDSIQSPRECQNYGIEKPLNARQFAELAKKCRARNRY